MRIRIRPVRWWRDDADRYRPRGAYVAPRQTFFIEALPPLDPELQRMLDAMPTSEQLAASMAVPAEMLWSESTTSPIEDIKAFQRRCIAEMKQRLR